MLFKYGSEMFSKFKITFCKKSNKYLKQKYWYE